MAITKLGNLLYKLAAMDESALEHARELLELLRANKIRRTKEEEFQIGTLPESVANEIYQQMGSDYRHSGNAAWALALNDLRHISSQHMNPEKADKKTQMTIDDFINGLRSIGIAADNGNLASAVSYGRKHNKSICNIPCNYKNPAVWSEDKRHIVGSQIPFAYLNVSRDGTFNVRTQYPKNLNKARNIRNEKPEQGVMYIPELEYRKL
jgi:hypothetical protein